MIENANLERVTSNIGDAVAEFVNTRHYQEFHASDLVAFVQDNIKTYIAPNSPTRVMQDMRKRGVINYQLLSRSKSLYQGLPMVDAA